MHERFARNLKAPFQQKDGSSFAMAAGHWALFERVNESGLVAVTRDIRLNPPEGSTRAPEYVSGGMFGVLPDAISITGCVTHHYRKK
ncbi:MAG: hypothetical protein IPG34_19400 [Rhodocyclaceae bacterium]|nr:hypothetical protein [Rhodocyclaceae bacterium]